MVVDGADTSGRKGRKVVNLGTGQERTENESKQPKKGTEEGSVTKKEINDWGILRGPPPAPLRAPSFTARETDCFHTPTRGLRECLRRSPDPALVARRTRSFAERNTSSKMRGVRHFVTQIDTALLHTDHAASYSALFAAKQTVRILYLRCVSIRSPD